MCTYNGTEYLIEQLDSIVNQTYPIYELIIQDDCSTDTTVSILKGYEKKYDFIHVYINENKKGVNENFFSAMERAKGDFIAFSDQDDIWEPDKLEVQINTIGDKWLSCGFSKQFSPGKDIFFDKRIPNTGVERLLFVNTVAGGHTMLLKKEMIPFIPKKTALLYDNAILIVAASNNMISFVSQVLVNHREHEKSVTYIVPVMKRGGNNKSFSNIIKSIFRTIRLYIELKDKIRIHFLEIYSILNELPDWNNKKIAMKIAEYQSKKGIVPYLKVTCYCIKMRKKLFYSKENDGILTFFRALFFPISCSDYFRGMSKHHQKANKEK